MYYVHIGLIKDNKECKYSIENAHVHAFIPVRYTNSNISKISKYESIQNSKITKGNSP